MMHKWVMVWMLLWVGVYANEASDVWRGYKSDAKIVEGLMWEDQELNKKRSLKIGEAREHCASLKLHYFGIDVEGWKLPSVRELKALHHYHKRLSHTTNNAYWSRDIGKKKAMMVRMSDANTFESYHPSMEANVRCVKVNTQGYPTQDASLFDTMNILTHTAEQKSLVRSVAKPKVPTNVTPMSLSKDEFETSAMFSRRVAKEKERVAHINREQKNAYEKALEAYKAKHNANKNEPLLRHQKTYLGKAMFIKYGKPLIESVEYNADEETFNIHVVSEKSAPRKTPLHKNLLSKEATLYSGLVTVTRIEHLSKSISEVSMTFHKRKYGFYFGSHLGAKVWDAHAKEWLTLKEYDRDWSFEKGDILKLKVPRIKSTCYIFGKHKIVLGESIPAFEADYKLFVPLAFAKKFKKLLLTNAFDIGVKVSLTNKKISIEGLDGITDPKKWVAEHDFSEAYENIESLKAFIKKYEGEPYVQKAKERKATLEARQVARAKENAKRAEQRAQKEAKEREAYTAKKRIGDKVCMEGKMLLFMTVEISGYVENVNANKIQIRIANTEGQTPNYHGVALRQDTIIWDDFDRWKRCE